MAIILAPLPADCETELTNTGLQSLTSALARNVASVGGSRIMTERVT